jgi:Zn-dependent protease
VNTRNLRQPRRDSILVTAAGPTSNMLIALVAAAASKAGVGAGGEWLSLFLTQALILNVLLAVFNMLPLPPLDGGQILMALLPPRVAAQLGFLYEYGFLILLGLLVSGVLWYVIGPPFYLILSWLR